MAVRRRYGEIVEKERVMGIKLERDEFHRWFGGGLPKSSICVIEGVEGGGKTIISQRLAYGLLENNYTVTYVSTELTIRDFIFQMASMNYNIVDYLLKKKLIFVSTLPLFAETKIDKNAMDRFFGKKDLFKTDVIIIDAINDQIIGEKNRENYARFVHLLKHITALKKTVIITVDPESVDNDFILALKSVSEIYIKLELHASESTIKRVMNITRFKAPLMQTGSKTSFRVEPKVGLVLEITSVA